MTALTLLDANGNPITCGALDVAGDPTAFDGNPVVELQDDGTFALAEQVAGVSASAGMLMNDNNYNWLVYYGHVRNTGDTYLQNGYLQDGRPGMYRPVDIGGVTYLQATPFFYADTIDSSNTECTESTNRMVHHQGPIAFTDDGDIPKTYAPYWATEGNSTPISLRMMRDPYIRTHHMEGSADLAPDNITAKLRVAVVTFDDAGYDGTEFTFTNPAVLAEYQHDMVNWVNEGDTSDGDYHGDGQDELACTAGIRRDDLRLFNFEVQIPDTVTQWSVFYALEYDGGVDPFPSGITQIFIKAIERIVEGGF